MVTKNSKIAAGETRDRVADLMSVMVEKFTDMTDVLDRGLRDIHDKLDGERFETPSGSGSRPRAHANSTPRRPDKFNKRSRCPFCGESECADPTKCALKIKWGSRLAIYKRRNLCPQKTCYKSHGGVCHKADSTKCAHCGRKHLSIWCVGPRGQYAVNAPEIFL